jgi:hypothetical protein
MPTDSFVNSLIEIAKEPSLTIVSELCLGNKGISHEGMSEACLASLRSDESLPWSVRDISAGLSAGVSGDAELMCLEECTPAD